MNFLNFALLCWLSIAQSELVVTLTVHVPHSNARRLSVEDQNAGSRTDNSTNGTDNLTVPYNEVLNSPSSKSDNESFVYGSTVLPWKAEFNVVVNWDLRSQPIDFEDASRLLQGTRDELSRFAYGATLSDEYRYPDKAKSDYFWIRNVNGARGGRLLRMIEVYSLLRFVLIQWTLDQHRLGQPQYNFRFAIRDIDPRVTQDVAAGGIRLRVIDPTTNDDESNPITQRALPHGILTAFSNNSNSSNPEPFEEVSLQVDDQTHVVLEVWVVQKLRPDSLLRILDGVAVDLVFYDSAKAVEGSYKYDAFDPSAIASGFYIEPEQGATWTYGNTRHLVRDVLIVWIYNRARERRLFGDFSFVVRANSEMSSIATGWTSYISKNKIE